MTTRLSERATRVKPSMTLAMNARAKKLKLSGGDIISLSVGEPDFDTPEHIKTAAIKAIQEGKTKYTATDGIPKLKKAIQTKFANENNLQYELDQIIVSCGAKHSLYNAMQALLNPGDEVLIPAPYWVSYPDMALLADAKPVIINTSHQHQYKITPEQLESHITDKTRLFILNSPSNPSGMAYSKEELAAFGEVLLKHPDIIILSDDIYEHILWTHNEFSNLANACPELTDRVVVINGVSKAYAMTGWRIGYTAGHADIIKAMKTIQSQSTSNPCSIAQYAAAAALAEPQQCVQDMVKEFKSRHDFVVESLNDIDGIQCHPSNGTFYVFPDVTGAVENTKGVDDDLALAEHILAKTGVATVPGSAFGASNSLRISFAAAVDKLDDAMKRLKTIL
ncbi:MAG: aspartate aminotransferase [Legionellales bacterium]|nr:aspartate aminotransferase [Legionellales bacterium]|tara:strand:+ start:20560 stop:21741 length:1182 start_codon:yes stop_codon:yes gene_type:complete